MKQTFIILILAMCFSSCQDVIDVDLPTAPPKLVVEAGFRFFTSESPARIDGGIRLSLSTDFLDGEIQLVDNAEVHITNLSNNETIEFTYNEDTGTYDPTEAAVTPDTDSDYKLTILYNGETYEATTNIILTVPIDNITQGDGSLFGANDTEIIISFTDESDRSDYYLFDLDFDEFITTEDEFYEGETFTFSYFYDDLESGQEINVNIVGLDEQYFNFMNLILEQSGASGGGPFGAAPAQVRGNLVNITNRDNYALGYFNLSQAFKSTITLN